MIKNYLNTQKKLQKSSHGGDGPVELFEIWQKANFESNVDFIDRVVVPPGSNIGFHQHENYNDMYVV